MGDSAFFDIVFFALVAVFLILRLRSVLGKRTGSENAERWRPRAPQPTTATRRPDLPLPDNVTRLPGRSEDEPTGERPAATTPLDAGLTQIRVADPSFDPKGFLGGAQAAFETIVGAFARGDTAALRPLLSDEIYDAFVGDVRKRQQDKLTRETTVVGVKGTDIVAARMEGRTAFVTVKFDSEQIDITRNAEGETVEGDPKRISTVTDRWTFARNTRSSDPNWLLVATGETD